MLGFARVSCQQLSAFYASKSKHPCTIGTPKNSCSSTKKSVHTNHKKGCTPFCIFVCILFSICTRTFQGLFQGCLGQPLTYLGAFYFSIYQHFVPTFANVSSQHFSTILLQQFPTFYVTICYHSCYHLLSFRLAIVSIPAGYFTSVFIDTVVSYVYPQKCKHNSAY